MKSIRSRRKSIAHIPQSRWVAYASAGAATALAGAGSAEAAIHYSGVLNAPFPSGSSAVGSFNMDNNAILRFVNIASGGGSGGVALFRIQGAAVSNMFVGVAAGTSGQFRYPSNLAFGANIAAGPFIGMNGNFFATLAYGHGYSNSKWLQGGTGFIGFRFNNGTGIEYGWARVTMAGDIANERPTNNGDRLTVLDAKHLGRGGIDAPGNSFTLVDYAWGDVGTAITAGQIPEPSSLGLLAVGAAGLLAWRKRRAKIAE